MYVSSNSCTFYTPRDLFLDEHLGMPILGTLVHNFPKLTNLQYYCNVLIQL
jgi:hypothetical protein